MKEKPEQEQMVFTFCCDDTDDTDDTGEGEGNKGEKEISGEIGIALRGLFP